MSLIFYFTNSFLSKLRKIRGDLTVIIFISMTVPFEDKSL